VLESDAPLPEESAGIDVLAVVLVVGSPPVESVADVVAAVTLVASLPSSPLPESPQAIGPPRPTNPAITRNRVRASRIGP
jgi:hypothetical protein